MRLIQPYIVIDTIKIDDKKFDITKKDNTYYLCSQSDEAGILSGFFYIWDRPKDIREDLLTEIDSVISGKVEFTEVGADIMGLAYIKPVITRMIGSNVGYSDLELPTKDFRELAVKWMNFLEAQENTNLTLRCT